MSNTEQWTKEFDALEKAGDIRMYPRHISYQGSIISLPAFIALRQKEYSEIHEQQ